MNSTNKQKSLILIIIGILVITISQIVSHFLNLSDFAQGACMGLGIGLLILAIVYGKYKTVREH